MVTLREKILEKTKEAIANRVFPGGVVGIVRTSGEREVIPFGNFTYDQDAPAMREDSIFDVASITKSIPTSSLALMLIDQGKLKLTDKLVDYVPEFRNSDRENVLVKHLLTYGLDGYGLASLKSKSTEELYEYLMTHDFKERPGTIFKYSNIPSTFLGLVVEKIFGDTLDVLADRYFFKPLAMNRTTFYPERFNKEEVVPTEIDDWRGLVQGVVHDESAYIYKQVGRVVGHAGLFSTAPDILNFLEMLLSRGSWNNKRYFSEEIIKQVATNQIAKLGDSTGLGWELKQSRYMSKLAGPHTFGKTGFTGTLCIGDIERGIGYVILTNRIYPKRPADSTAINAFRSDVGEIVFSSVL